MNRRSVFACLWGIAGMMVLPAAWAASVADVMHMGKIVAVDDKGLSIVDSQGENERFEVSSETKITRNGKTATLDELQVGDTVKLTARRQAGGWLAVTIEARSRQ